MKKQLFAPRVIISGRLVRCDGCIRLQMPAVAAPLARVCRAMSCRAGVRNREPKQSRTTGRSARQGRERPPRHGSRPGLAFPTVTAARPDGRPQRSDAEAPANTPPPRGSAPAPGPGHMGPPSTGIRAFENSGMQGHSPCGGEVIASAETSDRCCLPLVGSSRAVDHAGRVFEPGRRGRSRPCQAKTAAAREALEPENQISWNRRRPAFFRIAAPVRDIGDGPVGSANVGMAPVAVRDSTDRQAAPLSSRTPIPGDKI